MTAIKPLVQRAHTDVLEFDFRDTDVSELHALMIHFHGVGRPSLASETESLATRVRGVLESDGQCRATLITFTDFDRLMNRLPYAREIGDGCEAAIRDLAGRIWCGLTGDAEPNWLAGGVR